MVEEEEERGPAAEEGEGPVAVDAEEEGGPVEAADGRGGEAFQGDNLLPVSTAAAAGQGGSDGGAVARRVTLLGIKGSSSVGGGAQEGGLGGWLSAMRDIWK